MGLYPLLGIPAGQHLSIWGGCGWLEFSGKLDRAIPRKQEYVILKLRKLESIGVLKNFGTVVSMMERSRALDNPVSGPEGPRIVSTSLGKRQREYGVHSALVVRGKGTLKDPIVIEICVDLVRWFL